MDLSPRMARRIEVWPIDKLKPYERNARRHSTTQVDQLAASITEFGFNNPILVDTQEGVVAGHGRLEAAKRLGLDTVPVIVLDHMSEQQRRAYIIADNKLALNATWDQVLLDEELRALQADQIDLSLLGFSDTELARLADDLDEAAIDAMIGGDSDKPAAQSNPAQETEEEDQEEEAPKPDNGPQPLPQRNIGTELVNFSVVMEFDQRATVFAAINHAKSTFETQHSGEALYRIARRFLDEVS